MSEREDLNNALQLDAKPEKWSSKEVEQWLLSVGFEAKHAQLFVKEEINGEALFELSTDDFKELGIPMGVRVRVQKHIKLYKEKLASAEANFVMVEPEKSEDKHVEKKQETKPLMKVYKIDQKDKAPDLKSTDSNKSISPRSRFTTSATSLYARVRGVAPSPDAVEVSEPYDFRHESSVAFDGNAGKYVATNLPAGVAEVLSERGALVERNDTHEASTQSSSKQPTSKSSAARANATVRAKVLFKYVASTEEELSIEPGQYVLVDERDNSGWWRGRVEGTSRDLDGFFPAEFVHVEESNNSSNNNDDDDNDEKQEDSNNKKDAEEAEEGDSDKDKQSENTKDNEQENNDETAYF